MSIEKKRHRSRAPRGLSPTTRRTRAALMDAGLALFAERPVDAVAIDEIVKEANLSKGTFFNHFSDKYVFSHEISNEVRRQLIALVDEAKFESSDPIEWLCQGMVCITELALNHRKEASVLLRGIVWVTDETDPLNVHVARDVRDCMKAGEISPANPFTSILFWMGSCLILLAALVEKKPSRREAADITQSLLGKALRGLGAQEPKLSQAVLRAHQRLLHGEFD